MDEVLCAIWSEKREDKLLKWVAEKEGRCLVWVVEELTHMLEPSLPQVYKVFTGDDASIHQMATKLLYLPFIYEDPSHPALQKVARIQTEIHLRASDFIDQGIVLLANYFAHLHTPTAFAQDSFGKFKQFPAVVCGAGPSLKKVIPTLQKYHDQFLIIGCGAGMEVLLSSGIKPHLAVHIDPAPSHRFSKTDIPLFYQLRTSGFIAKQFHGNRFLMPGTGYFPLQQWLEEKMKLKAPFDGGWTAATCGAALATAFGCPSIYFAGVDFAASGGEVYAKGVDASKKKTKLIQVDLKDGSKIQTRSDWLLAADWLNGWVQKHPAHKWGTTSNTAKLMPAVPLVDLAACAGSIGVTSFATTLFAGCRTSEWKKAWQEISESLYRCSAMVDEFLIRFKKIFPKSPQDDGKCALILHDLEKEWGIQKIIDPIWHHWESVFKREKENHADALALHRILLIKSISSQYAGS